MCWLQLRLALTAGLLLLVCRGSIFGIGTLITPKKERVVRLWEHKDPDLKGEPISLTTCIK
jgi:hypothetical protein